MHKEAKSALISQTTSELDGLGESISLLSADPPYSKCRLLLYVLAITLGSFQYGYSLGVYSPVSKVLMQLF